MLISRYSQPQASTIVDLRHNPNFVISTLGGGLPREYVRGTNGTLVGGALTVPTRVGLGQKLNGSSAYVSFPSASNYDILGPLTLVWHGVINSLASFNFLLARAPSNGAASNPFELRINSSSGFVNLVRANADYNEWVSSSAVPLGVPVTIIVTQGDNIASAAGTACYINGVNVPFSMSVTSGTPGNAIGNTLPLMLGTRADLYSYAQTSGVLLAGFPRVFSVAEARELNNNLWQMFATTQKNIYVSLPLNSNVTVLPDLFTNTHVFYSPTITVIGGTVTLTVPLFSNTQTFYTPVLTNLYILNPSLFTNTNIIYNATVNSTYTVTPSLHTNTNVFYSSTLSNSNVLTVPIHINNNVFYTATLSNSNVLTAGLFTNSNTFYSHVLNNGYTLVPSLVTNVNIFYTSSVNVGSVTLTPSLYTNNNTFYTHSATQVYNLYPPLIPSSNIFYNASITASIVLTASLYTNTNTIYTHVATNSITVYPVFVSSNNIFYSPSMSGGTPLYTLSLRRFVSPVRNYVYTLSTKTHVYTLTTKNNIFVSITRTHALVSPSRTRLFISPERII